MTPTKVLELWESDRAVWVEASCVYVCVCVRVCVRVCTRVYVRLMALDTMFFLMCGCVRSDESFHD